MSPSQGPLTAHLIEGPGPGAGQRGPRERSQRPPAGVVYMVVRGRTRRVYAGPRGPETVSEGASRSSRTNRPFKSLPGGAEPRADGRASRPIAAADCPALVRLSIRSVISGWGRALRAKA